MTRAYATCVDAVWCVRDKTKKSYSECPTKKIFAKINLRAITTGSSMVIGGGGKIKTV